jgi:hypothetical protein
VVQRESEPSLTCLSEGVSVVLPELFRRLWNQAGLRILDPIAFSTKARVDFSGNAPAKTKFPFLQPVQVPSRGNAPMFRGIAKAFVIIGITIVADQFLHDGLYTDAALSMLREMQHSFH